MGLHPAWTLEDHLKEWKRESFPGSWDQPVKDCPWGVDSSNIQVCTYVGMVKSMVVLAEALRQQRLTLSLSGTKSLLQG